jgi:hypothetical protein
MKSRREERLSSRTVKATEFWAPLNAVMTARYTPEAVNADEGTVYEFCQLPQSTLPVVASIGLHAKLLLIVKLPDVLTSRPPRPSYQPMR